MKKIRIISLLMAVLMILPFAAACKTTEGDGTGTGTGTSTATGSNKPAKDDGTLNYINVDGLTYGKDGITSPSMTCTARKSPSPMSSRTMTAITTSRRTASSTSSVSTS